MVVRGSTTPQQLPCTEGGASDAYCPAGSAAAIPVRRGYFATPALAGGYHTGEAECPRGYYCPPYNGGLPCDAEQETIAASTSTAPCQPGDFCPAAYAQYAPPEPTPAACVVGQFCPEGRERVLPRCRPGIDSRSLGVALPCPAGTYGNATGLESPMCSGVCPSGALCPPGSQSPYRPLGAPPPADFCIGELWRHGDQSGVAPTAAASQFRFTRNEEMTTGAEAGGYADSGNEDGAVHVPSDAFQGGGESGAVLPGLSLARSRAWAVERAHELDAGDARKAVCPRGCWCESDGTMHACPAGRAGTIVGEAQPGCDSQCLEGHYCPAGSVTPRQLRCGSNALFCPAGSALPQLVPPGHVTVGGDATTRSATEPCPRGTYCAASIVRNCPAGLYGAREGEASPRCTGPCARGYTCPMRSLQPNSTACGRITAFCPLQSVVPVQHTPGFVTTRLRVLALPSARDVSASLAAIAWGPYVPSALTDPEASAAAGDVAVDDALASVAQPGRGRMAIRPQPASGSAGAGSRPGSSLGLDDPLPGLPLQYSRLLRRAARSAPAAVQASLRILDVCSLADGKPVSMRSQLAQRGLLAPEALAASVAGHPVAAADAAPPAGLLPALLPERAAGADAEGGAATEQGAGAAIAAWALEYARLRAPLSAVLPPAHAARIAVPMALLQRDGVAGPAPVTLDDPSQAVPGTPGAAIRMDVDGLAANPGIGLCRYAAWVFAQDRVELARLAAPRERGGSGSAAELFTPATAPPVFNDGAASAAASGAGSMGASGRPPAAIGSEALPQVLVVFGSFGNDDADTATVRDAQIPCEPGRYCIDSVAYPCPAGTYSAAWAATGPKTCAPCPTGYYCPIASIAPVPCGGVTMYCPGAGNAAPTLVDTGFYTTRELPDPATDLLSETGDPGRGNYVNVTAVALQALVLVNATMRDQALATRNFQRQCPPGTWCAGGIAHQCNPGRWGADYGMTTPECTGACERGFFCSAGSTSPQQQPCGNETAFCPEESFVATPVSDGFYTIGGRTRADGGSFPVDAPLLCNQTYSSEDLFPGDAAAAAPELPTSACAGSPLRLRTSPEGAPPSSDTLDGRGVQLGIDLSINGVAGVVNTRSECVVPRSPLLGPMVPVTFPPSARVRACTSGYMGDAGTRASQAQCEPGSYCWYGLRFECPPGRYGSRAGETHYRCEGDCPAGYICGWATVNATARECGGMDVYCPLGSAAATPVDRGHYSDPAEPRTRKTYQLRCQPGFYCVGAVRYACPPGTYQPIYGASSEDACLLGPPGYYLPHTNHSRPTDHACGDASVYCPTGSTAPTPVTAGWFTTGGLFSRVGIAENSTRLAQSPCAPGWYCEGGIARQCPAGRYGAVSLLRNADCSGPCERGHFCPPGSTTPRQYRCGDVFVFLADLSRLLRPPVNVASALLAKVLEMPNPGRSMLMQRSDGEVYSSDEAAAIGGGGGADATALRWARNNGSATAAVIEPDLAPPHDTARRMADLLRQLQQVLPPTVDAAAAVPASVTAQDAALLQPSDSFLFSLLARGGAHTAAAAAVPQGDMTIPTAAGGYGCALLSVADTLRAVTRLSWLPRGIDSTGAARISLVLTIEGVSVQKPGNTPIEGSGANSAACASLGYGLNLPDASVGPPTWDGSAIHVNVSYPWESGVRLKLPAIPLAVDSLVPLHRMLVQGGPTSVYCPEGSGEPLPVPLGHYSRNSPGSRYAPGGDPLPDGSGSNSAGTLAAQFGPANATNGTSYGASAGSASTSSTPTEPSSAWEDRTFAAMRDAHLLPAASNMTRDAVALVEPGFFAVAGAKMPCQPGLYGGSAGLVTRRCSGACPSGHRCRLGTSEPEPCPDGTFAPEGSWECIPCRTAAGGLPGTVARPEGTQGLDSWGAGGVTTAFPVDPATGYMFDPEDVIRLLAGGGSNGAGLGAGPTAPGDLGEVNRGLTNWDFPSVTDGSLLEGELTLPASRPNGMRCQHERSCCDL